MTASATPRMRFWQRLGLASLIALLLITVFLWIASVILRPHLPTQYDVVTGARARAELSGGARIFAVHCADCHDRGIAPWLGGQQRDAATVGAFVRSGPAAMPAFTHAQVSDADVKAIADYLATLPLAPAAKP